MRVAVLGLMLLAAAGCSSGHGTARVDPNRSIDVTGAIGGIRAREFRRDAERLLGRGDVISTVTRSVRGHAFHVVRVRYPASQLLVVYFATGEHARVFGVFTASPRYHTPNGLRVGSTLAQARREPGVHCYQQPGYLACQGGLGFEKPVTSFTVRGGRVVRVFMGAAAD